MSTDHSHDLTAQFQQAGEDYAQTLRERATKRDTGRMFADFINQQLHHQEGN